MHNEMLAVLAALCLAVLALGVLQLGTMRRVEAALTVIVKRPSDSSLAAGGVTVGAVVDEFFGLTPRGDRLSSSDVLASGGAVLFLEPGCAPCENLASQLTDEPLNADECALIVIVPDDEGGRRMASRLPGLALVDLGGAIARTFESNVTPNLFVLGAGGLVLGRQVPLDLAAVRQYMNSFHRVMAPQRQPAAFVQER